MSENQRLSLSSKMNEDLKNLIIKKMGVDDVDEVVEIENQSFSDPWKKEFFLNEISNALAYPLVAKLNQNVVGYSCLWIFLDELQIANIAVTPLFRKKGIGKKIMEKIISYAELNFLKRITLDVRESNKEAINLYNKFGFKTIGKRKNYYRFPVEDSLILEKILL